MNRPSIYLLLLCFAVFAESSTTQAQETKKEPFIIFDAIGIAVNHTMVGHYDGLTYQWGFGMGAYHSGRNGKRLDILFGMEYNLNRQVLDYRYDGRWAHTTDIQFTVHTLSVPLFMRLHLDRGLRFFVEGGAFMDVHLRAIERGVRHSYLPEEGVLNYTRSNTKNSAAMRNFNYGPYAGIGCRLSIAGRSFLLKAEARYGLPTLFEDMRTEMHLSYGRLAVVMEF